MISQNYPGANEYRTGSQGAAIGSGSQKTGATFSRQPGEKSSKIVVRTTPKTGLVARRPKTT